MLSRVILFAIRVNSLYFLSLPPKLLNLALDIVLQRVAFFDADLVHQAEAEAADTLQSIDIRFEGPVLFVLRFRQAVSGAPA